MPKDPSEAKKRQARRSRGRTAFRETFLYQMPLADERIFRGFGETIRGYGLEMTHYPPYRETPHNRASLAAVLGDLEYLEDFLGSEIDPPDTVSSGGERRLALEAGTLKQKLQELSTELRMALRKKPRKRENSHDEPD